MSPWHADQSLVCLLISSILGLQPCKAISIKSFERKPNRHAEHGNEHREHKQHRVVSRSEDSAEVLGDEPCAAKEQ
jgi:hypothetical protein